MKTYFITGTDTDVGKTVATAYLYRYFEEQGLKVAVMKPVLSGWLPEVNDIAIVKKWSKNNSILPLEDEWQCPYQLELPASPHLAAAEENVEISTEKLLDVKKKIIEKYQPDVLLIEGAGGLYVPLRKDYFIVDLIKDCQAEAILVTRPSLGTINHTGLSLAYMKAKGIPLKGLIVNNVPNDRDVILEENLRMLEEMSEGKFLGVIPEGSYSYREGYLKGL